MQNIVSLGLAVKKLPQFEVFDLQLPLMTSEVKIIWYQMFIDVIRAIIQKIASLSVVINY